MRFKLLCFILTAILATHSFGQTVTHGPIVGGVTSYSAVFVLRTDAPAWVQVELSTSQDFSTSMWTSAFNTANDSDYFGKVFASELTSSTEYYYRAVIGESPVVDGIERRFSTFPINTSKNGILVNSSSTRFFSSMIKRLLFSILLSALIIFWR